MKKILEPARFWKYFVHDLRNAKNNFGLSLLIIGSMPLIMYLFCHLIQLVFTGNWGFENPANGPIAFTLACLVTILMAPSKLYGRITDKRYGSAWLMLPASSFEKFLSMAVICLLLLPVCLLGLLFFTDWLPSLISNEYGPTVFYYATHINRIFENSGTNEVLQINIIPIGFAWWSSRILIFLLGAIFFKRAKVGYTILAYMGLSTVFSSLVFLCINLFSFNPAELFRGASPEGIINWANTFAATTYTIFIGALLCLIYLRIKKISH